MNHDDLRPPTDPSGLIVLPHSSLRVPHTRLAVFVYRELTIDARGIAFTATLTLDGRTVGIVFNGGVGGPTVFRSYTDRFTAWDLGAFACACRFESGRVPDVEDVLWGLVTEARTAPTIRRAAERGETPLRLVTSLHNDGSDPTPIGTATATLITTQTQRHLLAARLAETDPPEPGEWWQLWTGTAWDDLTSRPGTPDDSSEGAR